jgi:hypothetical protein
VVEKGVKIPEALAIAMMMMMIKIIIIDLLIIVPSTLMRNFPITIH